MECSRRPSDRLTEAGRGGGVLVGDRTGRGGGGERVLRLLLLWDGSGGGRLRRGGVLLVVLLRDPGVLLREQ